MRNTIFGKWLFGTMLFVAAMSLAACVDDNDDKGMPYLELGAAELAFTNEGGDAIFKVNSNRPWTVTLGEESDWIVVDPMEGVGAADVEISIPATNRGRVGTINFHVANTYDVFMTETVTVRQGEVAAIETIYAETVGTTSVSSPYPLVGAYTGWATDGSGVAEVNYTGTNASVRASGLANEGSGPNVIFFGAAPATFQVNKIALQPAQAALNLSFLGSFSYKPEEASEYNNTFDLSLFEVAISGDGEKWSKLDLTKNDGDTAHPYWVKAEADFELTEVPAYLYVRFTAGFSSAFRLDDIVLATSNASTSQSIDLSQGTTGGGVDPTPTPTPSNALWHEHFGDAGEDKPEVSAYTAWEKGGSVGANVTYTAVSGKVSVRETGKLSAGYSDASGAAKLFFGTNNPAFVAGDIALTNEQTKLTLNFGGAYSKNNSGTYDNTFYADKFHVYLSGDNEKWTEISYTTAKADEYWVYATANVTLTQAPAKLYVKFAADEASVYAIDDVQLAVGEGGQSVDLDNGTTGGDPTPTPDGPATTDLPAAGKYMFVWTIDGKTMAATPAETYYLLPKEVTVANNEIAAAGNETAVWTIEASATANLFTIKGSDGNYYTMKGDYNSFNKVDALGQTDYAYNWAFTKNEDGSFKVLNYEKQKWIQWDAQYSNVSASTKDGALPRLYKLNEAGTAYVDVAGGSVTPDPTPTPTPTDAIWYETFGTPVKEGSYWPYVAESTVNEMLGSGVVKGTTTYASSNVTARTVASQDAPNPPCSGSGHVWFPSNKTIDENYFTVEKLALNGETKLDISFYLYGNSKAYQTGDVVLSLSADGTNWVEVAFTTAAVTEATTDWVKATTSVTLKSAVEQLYIRFASATTAGVRMDDPKLTAGQGGTEIDLSATTPEPDPTPTPTTPLTVKELVQLMIAGTNYTDKTVEGYVAAFGNSGTENVSQGTIILTDNDGAEYSGLTVYKYDLSTLDLKVGDKIQIKLTNATTGDYSGLRQLVTVANEDVTVVSSGATISYKTLTGAQLNADYAKYLSVPVEIANATPTDASVGKTFSTSLTFNDGTDFTVYNRSKWAAGAEVTVNKVTAAVRGVVSVYGTSPQLVPTSKADIEAFGQSGTTPEPDPTPDPDPTPTPDPGTGGGTDDFATLATATSYGEQTTTAGWKGVNCAVQSGGDKDSNPVFKSLLGESDQVKGLVINGKTTAVGVITSPTLTGGCGTLSFDYGFAFSESNGINFKVEIMQAGAVVKSFDVVVAKADAVKFQKYSFSQEVGVTGDFQIVITNNSPSQNSGNKDRYTIFNIKWTGKN